MNQKQKNALPFFFVVSGRCTLCGAVVTDEEGQFAHLSEHVKEGKVFHGLRVWPDEVKLVPKPPSKPKIVCICCSSKFSDYAAVHAWNLEKMGILVLSIHYLPEWYWQATNKTGHGHAAEQEGVANILDELHLRKIEMADEVFIINPVIPGHEQGYIGERTKFEIAYAEKLGKPVKYMTPPRILQVANQT